MARTERRESPGSPYPDVGDAHVRSEDSRMDPTTRELLSQVHEALVEMRRSRVELAEARRLAVELRARAQKLVEASRLARASRPTLVLAGACVS